MILLPVKLLALRLVARIHERLRMSTLADLNTKADALSALVTQLAANQQPVGQQQQIDALAGKLDAAIVAASAALPAPAPAAPAN